MLVGKGVVGVWKWKLLLQPQKEGKPQIGDWPATAPAYWKLKPCIRRFWFNCHMGWSPVSDVKGSQIIIGHHGLKFSTWKFPQKWIGKWDGLPSPGQCASRSWHWRPLYLAPNKVPKCSLRAFSCRGLYFFHSSRIMLPVADPKKSLNQLCGWNFLRLSGGEGTSIAFGVIVGPLW